MGFLLEMEQVAEPFFTGFTWKLTVWAYLREEADPHRSIS
jgi:hypothetical protein